MRGGGLDSRGTRLGNLWHQKLRRQTTLHIDKIKLLCDCSVNALYPAGRVHLRFPVSQFEADDFCGVDKALADCRIKRIGIGQRDDKHFFICHAGFGIKGLTRCFKRWQLAMLFDQCFSLLHASLRSSSPGQRAGPCKYRVYSH